MKSISHWAKTHPWTARILIPLLHLIHAFLAISIGIILAINGVEIPQSVLGISITIFLLLALVYPSRKRRNSGLPARQAFMRYTYWRAKTMDLMIILCGLCMMVSLSNIEEVIALRSTTEFQVVPVVYKQHTKKEKRINRRQIRKQVRTSVKAALKTVLKERPLGEKILLSILAFAALVAIAYWVAGLSCHLSCSGSEGAATIVAIGGLALVILLGVIMVNGVFGRREKSK